MNSKNKKISLSKLDIIGSPKGDVYKILKRSSNNFNTFGEAYFSWINPKQEKGWKRHKKMQMNLVVPHGIVEFTFTENMEEKERYIFTIGEGSYNLLTVKPNIWFKFKCISNYRALVLNLADIEHDPEESENMEINQ